MDNLDGGRHDRPSSRPPHLMDGDPVEWDAFYTERTAIWSGHPNAQLVAEVEGLSPAAALDVGCGEGADAVWLAHRGWDVTAVDISEIALDRARTHATSAGCEINFVLADLVAEPIAGSFDLVSAQFFQLPDPARGRALTGLCDAVSPGGHLLVVGHDPEGHVGVGHPERLFTTGDIVALFPSPGWVVVTAEVRRRTAMHHGELTDMADAVVMLRRAR